MFEVKKQFERLVNRTINKTLDDWEIMNHLDDDAADEWGDMCSDTGMNKELILAKANHFLSKYLIDLQAVDVDTETANDCFIWSFK